MCKFKSVTWRTRVKSKFNDFAKRMCGYVFEENIDFSILKSGNPNGGIAKIDDYITTTDMAKDFGMSARKLNGILNKEGIQYKQGGQWFLYSQYQDKGFMQSSTDKEGHISSKWMQIGRKFIIEFLLNLGYALNKDINE